MSGGEALAASLSVKARLSRTACSARVTFRWRASARDRTYAAVSDATFFAIVSSIFCPSPETGCAAPMCVPGAMAATSAAIVSTNPADAARAPDGATNTTTGARDVIMRETIVRVDSRSPPGVRRTKTTSVAFERVGVVDDAGQVLGGNRVDDAVQLGDDDRRTLCGPGAGVRGRCHNHRQHQSAPPAASHG